MGSPDYFIEPLSAENLEELDKLFASVYQKKQEPGFFRKKYDSGYTGHKHIGFFAFDRNHFPIAFYGVIPCFLRQGDQRILAAQSTDTMTHPEYRHQGLFMDLAEHCFQLCKEHGIRLLFGFPNQHSLPGFLRLGWKESGCMDYFKIKASFISLAPFFSKFRLTSVLHRRYLIRLLKKQQTSEKGLANQLLKEGFEGVDRDADYLNYKTYSSTTVLKSENAKVWLKVKNGLAIGDILLDKETDFDRVMKSLLNLCRKSGLQDISFHTSRGTLLHTLFTNRYPATPSFPVIFKCLDDNLPTEGIKFTLADIDIF